MAENAAAETETGERMLVCIAVITYRRPDLLAQLLASLQEQRVAAGVDVRIVVVDNDPEGSAAEVVAASSGPWPVVSAVEPAPGIPAARQRSVDMCLDLGCDALVFVDDDEFAPAGWLQRLLDTQRRTGADVVTGPVRGILPAGSPDWARASDVYTSVDGHRTGARLGKAYTNNTLVMRPVLDAVQPAFHDAFRFTGSSDLHLFLRVARAGFAIVWDNEAEVAEHVPASRVSLRWLVRRAFRSGAGDTISRRLIAPGPASAAKSAALGAARMGSGVALCAVGATSPERRIKGLRRIVSGVGTLAGIVGINHAEYARR